MAVVAPSNLDGLFLQEALDSTGGLPVELDIRDLPLLVDEGEGVHPEALHVAVVQGNAHIILQEGELQCQAVSHSGTDKLCHKHFSQAALLSTDVDQAGTDAAAPGCSV